MTDKEVYDQLSLYTLKNRDPQFIHQYIVDTYPAQHFQNYSKPITVYFSLVGLYLHFERGFTGKQIQEAHMQLSKLRKTWPRFDAPSMAGTMPISDVLQYPEGEERDHVITLWSKSVWDAWHEQYVAIASLVFRDLHI